MKIEIGFDGCGNEAQLFADWLTEQGHDAFVGNSTASYVDGEANDEVMRELWDRFCLEEELQ